MSLIHVWDISLIRIIHESGLWQYLWQSNSCPSALMLQHSCYNIHGHASCPFPLPLMRLHECSYINGKIITAHSWARHECRVWPFMIMGSITNNSLLIWMVMLMTKGQWCMRILIIHECLYVPHVWPYLRYINPDINKRVLPH